MRHLGTALGRIIGPPRLRSSWPATERGRSPERIRLRVLTMVDTLAVMAASWGVLMATAPLLQIRRMLVRRSSADVSISYLGVLEIGFVLWVAYGISSGNPALIVPNATALVVGTVLIVVAWRYKGRPLAG
jgi:MtN3 and saliva related transmembrane protein